MRGSHARSLSGKTGFVRVVAQAIVVMIMMMIMMRHDDADDADEEDAMDARRLARVNTARARVAVAAAAS